MAERIEVLRGRFVPVVSAQPAITAYGSFTVNNAVNLVLTSNVGAAWVWVFENGMGWYKFQSKDNIRILSMWHVLPYHFQFANPGEWDPAHPAGGTLAWTRYGNVTGSAIIPEFGGANSGAYAPVANAETALDVYVPWPGGVGDTWIALRMGQTLQYAISMIGVPAALNGQVLYPTPFIKVLHTLDVIA